MTTRIVLAYDETVPALYESLDREEFSLTVKKNDTLVVYSFNDMQCSCSASPDPFEEKTCAPGNLIAKSYIGNSQLAVLIYSSNDQVDTRSFSHDTSIQVVATPVTTSAANECLYLSLTTLSYAAAHDPTTRINATSGVDNIVTFFNSKSKIDDRSVFNVPPVCKNVPCSGA